MIVYARSLAPPADSCGCVGHISRRKNQIAMVEAFAEVLRSSPEALLLIVGSALFPCYVPNEVSLRQKIEELGFRQTFGC